MKGFTESWLREQNLVPDGKGGFRPMTREEKQQVNIPAAPQPRETKQPVPVSSSMHRITLSLFGTPMPKQSVRSFVNKQGKIGTFQPKEMTDRMKDYQRQITQQLPQGFSMFVKRVHIRKLHFVFPPLKSFSKDTMTRIERGEIIWKETKPDLPDNLKKLVMDAMSGLVYKDDNIIVSEDDVKKYYGTGGMIIIELEGL
jgi:Holliday junction resolvase RusA-like endonuclease